MRQRWFGWRALRLHATAVAVVASCLLAGYWQATRALGGNNLSYAYTVLWPLFALLAIWGWWVLIHTDPSEAGAKGLAAKRAAAEGAGDPGAAGLAAGDPPPARTAPRRLADEDPELAAYNDRLAALAAEGRPKTWRRP